MMLLILKYGAYRTYDLRPIVSNWELLVGIAQ